MTLLETFCKSSQLHHFDAAGNSEVTQPERGSLYLEIQTSCTKFHEHGDWSSLYHASFAILSNSGFLHEPHEVSHTSVVQTKLALDALDRAGCWLDPCQSAALADPRQKVLREALKIREVAESHPGQKPSHNYSDSHVGRTPWRRLTKRERVVQPTSLSRDHEILRMEKVDLPRDQERRSKKERNRRKQEFHMPRRYHKCGMKTLHFLEVAQVF